MLAMCLSLMRRHPVRRGAAVVEFAVCLPVLLVLVIGAIECTTMIFIKQSLNVVAYEGIRTAIRPAATSTDVATRCQAVITERGLQQCVVTIGETTSSRVTNADGTITITEAVRPVTDLSTINRGTELAVVVTVPSAANAAMPLRFFRPQLSATAVMVKE